MTESCICRNLVSVKNVVNLGRTSPEVSACQRRRLAWQDVSLAALAAPAPPDKRRARTTSKSIVFVTTAVAPIACWRANSSRACLHKKLTSGPRPPFPSRPWPALGPSLAAGRISRFNKQYLASSKQNRRPSSPSLRHPLQG